MSEDAVDPPPPIVGVRHSFMVRLATMAEAPALRALIRAATEILQVGFLSPAQIRASHDIMGLDTQLIHDGTYFVVELDGGPAGCGGWSRRATLYGGDGSVVSRAPRLLNPATDAARIRAMYTSPSQARRGVASTILSTCEEQAAIAGFGKAELMATLSGEPLYRRCGYLPAGEVVESVGQVTVPLIRMRKALGNVNKG